MVSSCACGPRRSRSLRHIRRSFRQCGSNRRKTSRSAYAPLVNIIASGMIQAISAVTFAVRDMARSVEFYQRLGFELVYGGEQAAFSSLKAGDAFINLAASPGYEHRWWGRAIFRVDDVDAHHRQLKAQGLMADSPQDALGVSASFTSLIRMGTRSALRSLCGSTKTRRAFAQLGWMEKGL